MQPQGINDGWPKVLSSLKALLKSRGPVGPNASRDCSG